MLRAYPLSRVALIPCGQSALFEFAVSASLVEAKHTASEPAASGVLPPQPARPPAWSVAAAYLRMYLECVTLANCYICSKVDGAHSTFVRSCKQVCWRNAGHPQPRAAAACIPTSCDAVLWNLPRYESGVADG